jgi:hypothetical protein
LWKNELIKILFSSDPSNINVEKAIDLKYKNTNSSLYKYKSFDEDNYSLELLKTDKMWLSRPTSFNDPFDCGLKLASKDLPDNYIKDVLVEYVFNDLKQNFGCSNKELGKLKRSKEVVSDLAKFIVKTTKPNISLEERTIRIEEEKKAFKEGYLDLGLKKNIHVACFSETYESILMWSHYANDHKGFCIEYNFKELGLNNHVTRFIFPVIYNNTIFDMKDYLPDSNKHFENVLENYMAGINPKDILHGITFPEKDNHVNNMVLFYNALNKSEVWEYEKEWRYIFPYKNIENKDIYLPVPKPKAIYLGAMVSKENYEKILEIGKEKDINIYKMAIKPSEFALEPIVIHESNK